MDINFFCIENWSLLIGGASRWVILVLFNSATIKYGVLWQEGKNGRFYEAKVALDFDL